MGVWLFFSAGPMKNLELFNIIIVEQRWSSNSYFWDFEINEAEMNSLNRIHPVTTLKQNLLMLRIVVIVF